MTGVQTCALPILLYIAGSLVWIKRSTYRRDQRIKQARGHSHIKTKCPHRLLYLPEPVYECLPFAYLAAGIAAYSLVPGQTGFMLGAVAWFAGALVLILRSANRHRH